MNFAIPLTRKKEITKGRIILPSVQGGGATPEEKEKNDFLTERASQDTIFYIDEKDQFALSNHRTFPDVYNGKAPTHLHKIRPIRLFWLGSGTVDARFRDYQDQDLYNSQGLRDKISEELVNDLTGFCIKYYQNFDKTPKYEREIQERLGRARHRSFRRSFKLNFEKSTYTYKLVNDIIAGNKVNLPETVQIWEEVFAPTPLISKEELDQVIANFKNFKKTYDLEEEKKRVANLKKII